MSEMNFELMTESRSLPVIPTDENEIFLTIENYKLEEIK